MKAGRHLSLFSESAKNLKSVGSRRQMLLTTEEQRVEQRKHQMNGCFWFQSQKRAPQKKGSWSGWGTLLLLESCNKNDGLGAPPREQPQSKNQSNLHHITQFANEWTRRVSVLTEWGARWTWTPKHSCNVSGFLFLPSHRPLTPLAQWICTLLLNTGLASKWQPW